MQLAGGLLIVTGIAVVRIDEGRPDAIDALVIQPAT
jgi:hypothetical protein